MKALLAATLLVGCYKPSAEGPCEVSCNAAAPECPSGLVCINDLCRNVGDDVCVDAGVTGDGPDGADAPDARDGCFGAQFFSEPICPTTVVLPAISLANTGISTDGTFCTEVLNRDGVDLCVYTATSIVVSLTTRFSGSRPIVLIATDTISISGGGVLDVGSKRLGPPGAAANVGCPTPVAGMNFNNSAGGGAGGSYATQGGAGGNGGNGGLGMGSLAGGSRSPLPLGGCPGSPGGDGGNGGTGFGSPGGGAAILLAGQGIVVEGTVHATGGGGTGASAAFAGGGGGGSGGLIVLEAPSVSGNGELLATGGGGGGGGGDATGGTAGADGTSANQVLGASGGLAGSDGGGGGRGSIGAVGGEGVTAPSYGGGGGGGGAGYIRIFAALKLLTGTVAPPASPVAPPASPVAPAS